MKPWMRHRQRARLGNLLVKEQQVKVDDTRAMLGPPHRLAPARAPAAHDALDCQQSPHQCVRSHFGFYFDYAVQKRSFYFAHRLSLVDRRLANDMGTRQACDSLDRLPVVGGSIAEIGAYSNES